MGKKFYLFCKLNLILSLFVVSSVAYAADITTGLKLHYSFDAIAGATVNDDSGNGNAGTLNGEMLTPVDGYSGSGVQGLVKADYINLPVDFTTSLSSFTFTTWVKFSSLKNATRFFDFGNGADATNNFLAFIPSYNGDNGYMCLRYRPASGTAYNVLSTTKIPVDAWAHVALTFSWDGSNANVIIYLNGAQVGSGTIPSFNPALLGSTANNYLAYSRWTQDTNGFNGTLDEVRFYNRALAPADVLYLSGLDELNTQYSSLTANTLIPGGDLYHVASNLTLPTTLGTKGVTVQWTTSDSSVVDLNGVITQPDKYNAPAVLTATLSQVINGKSYNMTKEFRVFVLGLTPTPEVIAQWNFKNDAVAVQDGVVTVRALGDDEAPIDLVGTLKNDARIRTIGAPGSDQFNVLDLGNGTGYFDMGTEIGKAIYSLADYTVAGYFRVDENYTSLSSNGNFYWTFSNSADSGTDQNGYMIGSLKGQSQSVSTNYWNSGNQATGPGTPAEQGKWHHIAYVQNVNVGTIYIDGVQISENTAMTNLPAFSIPKSGFTGTLYNWLGRSCYATDAYLRNTLLYDFRLLSVPLTATDIALDYLGVSNTLDLLNNAYASNPDYLAGELVTEKDNLDLGDLSEVKTNLTLPTKGKIDTSISIVWKSSNLNLIDAAGVVTRPDFYNYTDTLTATFIKNGQSVNKKFYATVVAKDGTPFANDLLVKYDFSQVSSDSIVTDVAEKHFQGKVKNEAAIGAIGTSTVYKVLSLGDSIGYFDMGTDVGKLMYNLQDFTVSAYYRIDNSYEDTELAKNGNFLWNFSNSNDILNKAATGYFIGSLRNQAATITPTNWTPEQTVLVDTPASKGTWCNMTYTQSGTTGTLYVDGSPVATGEVTQLPKNTLSKEGLLGTAYNWIGRSCYTGDVYLRNTLVYDFRLYRVALTESQIQTSELNVGNTIAALNNAYTESGGVLNSINPSALDGGYAVKGGTGSIRISGLNGTEKVSVYDLSGRLVSRASQSVINAKSGIYIVKINNYVSKVIVK